MRCRFLEYLLALVFPFLLVSAPALNASPSFLGELQVMYDVAGCANVATVNDMSKAVVVTKHCRRLNGMLDEFQARWMSRAVPFFEAQIPADVPATVVAPFGGADLGMMLVVYPRAREYLTISLEPAGDPRRFGKLDTSKLGSSLEGMITVLKPYLDWLHHATVRLERYEVWPVPGEYAVAFAAMRLCGYEPVDLRFFEFDDAGRLVYLEREQLELPDGDAHARTPREFFVNLELTFRSTTDPTDTRVYRHVSQDLRDTHFGENTPLLKHLNAKGRVSAMVKAGSYLIQESDFSQIRDYVLDHATIIVSDATGPLPAHAAKAGFEQTTWGRYMGAPKYTPQGAKFDSAWTGLWDSQPARELAFRFGYGDKSLGNHLLITRRRETPSK